MDYYCLGVLFGRVGSGRGDFSENRSGSGYVIPEPIPTGTSFGSVWGGFSPVGECRVFGSTEVGLIGPNWAKDKKIKMGQFKKSV